MKPDEWEHTTASFVIRLRRRQSQAREDGVEQTPWLGRIEHAQTGQRAPLHRLDDVLPFILRCLKDSAPLLVLATAACIPFDIIAAL